MTKLKSFILGLMLSTLTLPGVVNANVFVADGFNIVITPDHFPIIWKKSQQYGFDFSVTALDLQNMELCNASNGCDQAAIDAGAVYYKIYTVNGITLIAYYDANGNLVGTKEDNNAVEPITPTIPNFNYTDISFQTTNVGNTATSFDVTQMGAASYSIPLNIAPGVAGMQPSLSINYSSQPSYGDMGVGFNINANSAITRCNNNKTPAQGLSDGIGEDMLTFSNIDTFCLNGQRLIPINGENGLNGTEYRTEIEGYSRIVSYGNVNGGPQHFKIWTKSGQVMEYGNTVDSFIEPKDADRYSLTPNVVVRGYVPPLQPAYAWAISRITDASDNYMTYHYDERNTGAIEYYLKEIRYTGNTTTGLAPVNTIQFNYNEISNGVDSFLGGFTFRKTSLMSNVTTYTDSQKTRQYKVQYQTSARTSKKLVSSIQECSYQVTEFCFQPVTFNWGKAPASGTPQLVSRVLGNIDISGYSALKIKTAEESTIRDFRPVSLLNTSSQQILIGPLSDGTLGYFDPASNTTNLISNTAYGFWADATYAAFTRIADFSGDGLPDLLLGPNKSTQWFGLTINTDYGAGLNDIAVSAADLGHVTTAYSYLHTSRYKFPGHILPMDLDGDAISDILIPTTSSTSCSNIFDCDYLATEWNSIYTTANSSTSFSLTPKKLRATNDGGHNFLVLDINGDGLSDVFAYERNKTYFSTRDSLGLIEGLIHEPFLFEIMDYPDADPDCDTCSVVENQLPKVIDFNGDGLTDVLLASSAKINGVSYQSKWGVALSSGHGFFDAGVRLNTNSGELYNSKRIIPFDVNHDGKTDIIVPKYGDIGSYRYFESNGVSFVEKTLTLRDDGGIRADPFFGDTVGARVGEAGKFDRMTIADFDGDGIQELVFLVGEGGKVFALEPDIDIQSDMLTGIQNGDGLKTTIAYNTYDNVTPDAKNITCSTNTAAKEYTVDNLCNDSHYQSMSIYLVDKVEKELPQGGSTVTSFKYSGSGIDHKRGFVGFSWFEKTDETQKIRVTKKFHQKFPFTGMPAYAKKETVVYDAANNKYISDKLVSETNYSYTNHPTHYEVVYDALGNPIPGQQGPALIHMPLLTKTIANEYEINTNTHYRKITTEIALDPSRPNEVQVDEYGNTLWQRVTIADPNDTTQLYSTTSVSEFDNIVDDLSVANPRWHLGRLTRSTVTASAPDNPGQIVPDQVRVAAFEYYPTSGLLHREISEPDATSGAALAQKRITEYQYDNYGRKQLVTVKGWDHTGQALANRTSQSDISFVYSSEFGKTVQQTVNTNALNQSETIEYDLATGQALSQTGPNGLTTYWYYDAFGRQIGERTPSGIVSETVYNWSTASYAPSYFSVTSKTTGQADVTAYFDKSEREIRVQSVDALGDVVITDTDYNNRGYIDQKSDPHYPGDTEYWTTFTYDALGRVSSQSHDGIPNLNQQYTTLTTYTDYNGLSTTVTNAKGQQTTSTSNVMDKVTRVDQSMGSVLKYYYDANQNMVQVIDAINQSTTFVYDDYGRKISMTDPVMGKWDYQYNSFDELVWQQNPEQQNLSKATTINYDVLGRLATRNEDEGTTTWTYGTATGEIGKLISVSSPGGTQKTISYDYLLRPEVTTQSYMGETLSSKIIYDELSRVKHEIRPDNFVLEYSYNSQGTLMAIMSPKSVVPDYNETRFNNLAPQSVKDLAGTDNAVWWALQNVNAKNQVINQYQGNGLSTKTDFDEATGVPLRIRAGVGLLGDETQHLNYAYDALHNLEMKQDLVPSMNIEERFTYDDLNRLDVATVKDLSSAAGQSVANDYHYDLAGNITGINTNDSYHYSSPTGGKRLDSVDGIGSYQYDDNGNVIISPTAEDIKYHSFNKPYQFKKGTDKSTQFVYDEDHSRIQRYEVRGTKTIRTHYLGKAYEKVTTNDNGSVKEEHKNYIYAGGKLVAISKRNPANGTAFSQYIHADVLGSTNTVSNSGGTVIDRMSYTPFGKRRAIDWRTDLSFALAEVLSTNRGYTGHEHIDEFNLIHMNGRVYDPTVGRFLSPDPFVQSPGDSKSFNRYSYVHNNPLSNTDPSGYFSVTAFFRHYNSEFTMVVKAVIAAQNPLAAAALAYSDTYRATGNRREASMNALKAAFFQQLGQEIGEAAKGADAISSTEMIFAYGVAGGMNSMMSGGSFGEGFATGAMMGALKAGGAFNEIDTTSTAGDYIQNMAVAAVAGGISAKVGGGKFANGALTGSFVRLFGDLNSSGRPGKRKLGTGSGSKNKALTKDELILAIKRLRTISGFSKMEAEAEALNGGKLNYVLGDESSSYNRTITINRWYGGDSYTTNDYPQGGYDVEIAWELATDMSTAAGVQVKFSLERIIYHEVNHATLPAFHSESTVISNTNTFMKSNFSEYGRADHNIHPIDK